LGNIPRPSSLGSITSSGGEFQRLFLRSSINVRLSTSHSPARKILELHPPEQFLT
jgi:hypothetical protein